MINRHPQDVPPIEYIPYFCGTPYYISELIYKNTMSKFLFSPTQNYKTLLHHERESNIYLTRDFDKIELNRNESVETIDEHEFDFRGVAEVMLQQSTHHVIIPYIPRLHLK